MEMVHKILDPDSAIFFFANYRCSKYYVPVQTGLHRINELLAILNVDILALTQVDMI